MVSLDAGTRAARGSAAGKASRVWWLVHQWVGLKLSLFMGFILLTGTLAVFAHEIDWLINPAQRVAASGVTGHNWPAMARGAASVLREGEAVRSLEAPVDDGFSARAVVARLGGGEDDGPPPRWVYLHPTTGEVLGQGSWLTVQRVLRNAHRHLFLPTRIGVPIVSALSILLLVSLITSFVVYKKWWRGFFKPIRLHNLRTAMGDAHRLMGLWGLWFVALMALTGMWYLVESLGGEAPRLPRASVPAVAISSAAQDAAFTRAVAAARSAHQDLRIQRIVFPTRTSGAFQFHGDHKAILVRPRANAVWVEAATGEIVLVTDGRDLDAHQRISEAADPLHFGTWGGVRSKIIWFVFGLMLTGLCLSGAAIYSGRQLRTAPTAGADAHLATMWRGMGLWRWPSLAALATCVVLFVGFVASVLAPA